MSSSHPPHTTTGLKALSSARRMWQESKRLFLLFKSAAAICVWRSQGQKTWLFLWVNYSRTQQGLLKQYGGCVLLMLACRNPFHSLYWHLILHMKDTGPALGGQDPSHQAAAGQLSHWLCWMTAAPAKPPPPHLTQCNMGRKAVQLRDTCHHHTSAAWARSTPH